MRIALDFDNTFTADPDLWLGFIRSAMNRGHTVVIVTSRHPQTAVPIDGIEIVYCSFKAKRKYYQADIWIDDDPKHIDMDHALQLA